MENQKFFSKTVQIKEVIKFAAWILFFVQVVASIFMFCHMWILIVDNTIINQELEQQKTSYEKRLAGLDKERSFANDELNTPFGSRSIDQLK